ncbi:MAG: UDP-N-acetylenolpyruvoylglucosamine reductase [Ignavibacteria bacterium]
MIDFREDVPLAPYTTIGLGGRAKYFVECRSVDEVCATIRVAAEQGSPLHVLGGGSNTIFRDEGFDGVVLKTAMKGLHVQRDGREVTVSIAAGEEWDAFVRFCVSNGLAGVECLSGIPGLVGAAPMQNIGAYGQEVAETIVDVIALDRKKLEEMRFSNEECRFDYRRSRFNMEDANAFVITEVTFRLRPDGEAAVRYPELQRYLQAHAGIASLKPGSEQLSAVREAVLALRRKKSMVIDPADPHSRSVGSFFKNPLLSHSDLEALRARCRSLGIASPPTFPSEEHIKVPAAWLLEQAGFVKGYRKGGVGVSAHHALALVNYGGNTRELLVLAQEIQSTVFEKFGIHLEREPVIVS